MINWTRMALAYDGPLPGYTPRTPIAAEVVTFPHLRRQSDETITRHAILAEQEGLADYATGCTDEMARRAEHRRLA